MENQDNIEKPVKENIYNIPNLFTFSRLIIAILTIYFIFAEYNIIYVVVAFSIGMLTDFFDGWTARKFHMETEFGRQFDMIADRILIAGVALALVIKFSMLGILTGSHYFQLAFLMIREIITTPVALVAMFSGAGIPQVRIIGKIVTVMQSITFPILLLGIFYSFFSFSIYFVIVTGITGLIASYYYVNDMKMLMKNNKK